MSNKKKCNSCGINKRLTEFHKQKSIKSGYRGDCKKCIKVKSKKYFESNREEIRRKSKLYYSKNSEMLSEKQKIYREKNKDKLKQYFKDHHLKNKDKRNEQSRKYYHENNDAMKLASKQWREANKYYVKNYRDTYRKSDIYEEKNPEWQRKYRENNKLKLRKLSKDRYKENKDSILLENKKRRRIDTDSLSDVYIKTLMCGNGSNLNFADVPNELIEIKRLQIQIKRELKDEKYN